ncbi:MAG TPA: rod shape-determining protein MreC [Myxococcota bacterium]|jgi:rod shape-determining protein MreC
MAEFRNRTPVTALVVGLVAFAVVAMVVDRRSAPGDPERELSGWTGAILDIAAPVQKMIAFPFDLTRNAWRHYVSLLDASDTNEGLRARLAAVEEENLQLREALIASGRLARIAETRADFEVPMLPSELVGVDPSPWFRSVLIDRGREQGVRSGMPIISEHGLVGLVTATSTRAAKAMLVLDRQSAIDGIIQRSRSQGIVRGRGTSELDFEFVIRGSDVRIGDVVITSGLGGVYPKGIRIAEVVSVSDPGSALMQTAKLVPAVDFGRLEQVFVMLRRGPTMEVIYASELEGDLSTMATERFGP